MGQGHIRKGFFFYFGLFVLLLITVFCICLVIMMFNPGKTVLWMQYFTGEGKYEFVEKTNNEDVSTNINWESVTELEINCTYSKIIVERNNDRAMPKDGVYIYNNAKGFCASSDVVPFETKVSLNGTKVKIDVTEAKGFLYFSKDIKIILHASTARDLDFKRINLIANTTDGDIDIGGTNAKDGREVSLASLKAKTEKGNIQISKNFNTYSLNNGEKPLSLTTTKGIIHSAKEISITNKDGTQKTLKGIALSCDAEIIVNGKGKIEVDAFKMPSNNLSLICQNGIILVNHITAVETSVVCEHGNHRFGEIMGNLSYKNANDFILAPVIKIGYIKDNFYLSSVNGKESAPEINIDEIGGAVSVIADKGNFVVGKANGTLDITSKRMGINVVLAKDYNKTVKIINEFAPITLGFAGNVPSIISIENKTGEITINLTKTAKFRAEMNTNPDSQDAESTLLEDKFITVNVGNELLENQTKNPLVVNKGSNILKIKTNSGVKFNLVESLLEDEN